MKLIDGFRDAREKYGEPVGRMAGTKNEAVLDGEKNYAGECSYTYTFGKAYKLRKRKRCVCPICGTRVDCSRDDCAECGSTEPGVWC